MEKIKNYKSLEEVSVTVREATLEDVQMIEDFLSRPEIDSLFVPALSNSVRGMTIRERVEKKINNGTWIIAIEEGKKIVGCMAVVPANITKEVQFSKKENFISEGISLDEWKKEKIWELSTVVVDKEFSQKNKVKGIGKSLFEIAKNWVRVKGNKDGLITDSWIGGEMGGFVMAMNAKDYQKRQDKKYAEVPNTLMRMYTDPGKRGENGPLTVIYGIPVDDEDWHFLESKQQEIKKLVQEYDNRTKI